MSFLLIKGTFHLVDRNAAGKETGFQPDGDSMQFKPDDPGLLGQLTVLAQPVRLTLIGSTQLRFEGIDALDSHFSAPGGTPHQPLGLANDARNFLTKTF